MAVPIDVAARKITGSPVPLVDSVPVCPACNGDAAVHASRSGTLTYYRGSTLNRLVWLGRNGSVQPLRPELAAHQAPRLSPDGSRIAVEITKGVPDVWILTLAGGTLSRLTSGGSNSEPEWSADGKYIYFSSDRDTKPGVWRMRADGSGAAERVATTQAGANYSVSPDGKSVIFTTFTTSLELMQVQVGDTNRAIPFLTTRANELAPRFSPDGKWVAYASDETSVTEVYVRPFVGDGGRVQVSSAGGGEPAWSADGKKLYYRVGSRMMAANLAVGATISVVTRDTVFNATFNGSGQSTGYDVTRDGSRILGILGDQASLQVVVVANWLAEVRARVGKK